MATIANKQFTSRRNAHSRELTKLKASIYYYRRLMATETNEDKIKKYQSIIDEHEYQRFLYKLNSKQRQAIMLYCRYNGYKCVLPEAD